MLNLILLVLAIENLANILSTVDLLEPARTCFETKFPKMGKLARCAYCQAFWIALLACTLGLPNWFVMTLAIHRLCVFLTEFSERYLGRAPLSIFVRQSKD